MAVALVIAACGTQTTSVPPTVEPSTKALALIVADRVAQSDPTCPENDLVTHESCLLFQNALGIWHSLGTPRECPMKRVRGTDSTQETDSSADAQGGRSGGGSSPLGSEEILRASASPCFAYLYAIGVVNVVPVLVSTANRTFQLAISAAIDEPGSDPERCLMARHGICGNHAAVALALLSRAGFDARPVEFYYTIGSERRNHIVPEVFVDGDWRLLGTTYGSYWVDRSDPSVFSLAPTDRIIEDRLLPDYANDSLLPFGLYDTIGDLERFEYLTHEPVVVRGGQGTVAIDVSPMEGIEWFLNLPNFVGDNLIDGDTDGIDFSLSGAAGRTMHLSVNVQAVPVLLDNPLLELCVDETCQPFVEGTMRYTFTVANPRRVHLRAAVDLAYLVFESIEWTTVPPAAAGGGGR